MKCMNEITYLQVCQKCYLGKEPFLYISHHSLLWATTLYLAHILSTVHILCHNLYISNFQKKNTFMGVEINIFFLVS